MFAALDERWLKPFLVHKYSAEKVHAVNVIEDEMEIMMDGDFDVIVADRKMEERLK